MLNRKQMIKELTMYELKWFLENDDKNSLTELVDFFSAGGFIAWDDDKLQRKYDLFIQGEL